MDQLAQALLYATLAGATIPLAGAIARWGRIRPRSLESELHHSVIAFGGGVLLAAVALVLVPEGMRHLAPAEVTLSFAAGGLAFFWLDRAIERAGEAASQLIAMLLDFVPEAMALGAMLAAGAEGALLLAILIALQNVAEGFNAYREIVGRGRLSPDMVLAAFAVLVLLGPLSAYLGHHFLAHRPELLGALMLFAAAGILYLTFQDIAPEARLRRHWAPPLGAVAGFLLGLIGQMLLG